MKTIAMTEIMELHKTWLRDDPYRKEYDALNEEFETVSGWVPAINAGMIPVEDPAPLPDDSSTSSPVAVRT